MEQLGLTTTGSRDYHLTARNIELVMLSKRIRIKLTNEQIRSLVQLMTHYIFHHPLISMQDKVTMFHLVKLESSLRPQAFMPRGINLGLNIPQAQSLFQMFCDFNLQEHEYETMLGNYIMGEIDHQIR